MKDIYNDIIHRLYLVEILKIFRQSLCNEFRTVGVATQDQKEELGV